MTSIPVARALARSGVLWEPSRGDRFVIPDRGMDAEVFVLSDMTIEAHDHPTGATLGFNGTTEWALDSVAAADALWLPVEGQSRALLGDAFVSLTADGGDWLVTTTTADGPTTTAHPDTEEAYALALLAVRAGAARDLLPVAAHGLARQLAALGGPGSPAWSTTAPDGVRTVAQVISAALGADVSGGWQEPLADLLTAWAGPASGDEEVAEAGARGVLVDLLVATWDVAVATGGEVVLDPACVRLALGHVRTWGTTGGAAPTFGDPAAGSAQSELLARTGR